MINECYTTYAVNLTFEGSSLGKSTDNHYTPTAEETETYKNANPA